MTRLSLRGRARDVKLRESGAMPSIRATPKALVVLKTLKRIEIGQASGTHTMQILYVRERFFLCLEGGLVTFFWLRM